MDYTSRRLGSVIDFPVLLMQKRKLPIGIQTFEKIRNEDCYYVDKTELIYQLVQQGTYYFLSRPRRFGKSLLLDTIKELFEGNQVLFQGLFIEDKWDWSKKHPVIRLSFGSGVLRNRQELDDRINSLLKASAADLGLVIDEAEDIPGKLTALLAQASKKFNRQVALLIDEYDKPILDNIVTTDIAREMREGLKNIYTVIKDADAHIKFCLITGVSKFSKVSLFSGLNNLNDITLDARYSAICGYTDYDVDTVFAAELPGLNRDDIRRWYNGYHWCGESIYNPFDVLLLFNKREFKPYWFETATPTFLVDMLRQREFFTPQLSKLVSDYELLGQFDVDHIGIEALLFQTGYLTIGEVSQPLTGVMSYELTYPNLEVEVSLNKALLPNLGMSIGTVTRTRDTVLGALKQLDFELLQTHLKSLYASIPSDWYRKNTIANYEGHYASVFYSHFAALGLHVAVEDASNQGRVDMVIEFNSTVFIFEFKVVVDQPAGEALKQIKSKRYADKYRNTNSCIYLIGVEFSKAQKQIVGFEVERGN
jgi:hypothetical protein